MTLIIDENDGLNEMYQASELYLSTRIAPSIDHLKVSKSPRQKNLCVTINKGEKIVDEFEGMQLSWEFCCSETKKANVDYECYTSTTEIIEHKSIRVNFHKQYKDKVLDTYLPYIEERSKAIKEKTNSVIFDHPTTFDTLAMEPKLKNELIENLDRFVKRNEFYDRVGKVWKRGYLLYRPPGTGKSSLIAAMENHHQFDIYDLELTHLQSNSELRKLLVSTLNRSIIMIEDIDCNTV